MSGNKPHDDAAGEGKGKRLGPKCGAENRAGKPCGQAAGWGTDHPGTGRCKLHGGLSTGPATKEGKATVALNALKHGLWTDRFLSEQERQLYDALQTEITEACDLDIGNQLLLHRALMNFIKTHRRDAWEFEEATRLAAANDFKRMMQMDGGAPAPQTLGDVIEEAADKAGCDPTPFESKSVPDLDKRFAKFMELLGLDRRFRLQRESREGNLANAIDAFSWLFGGSKSKGA